MTEFTICIFKLRLGGEISHSVDNIHQGLNSARDARNKDQLFLNGTLIILTALILLFWFILSSPSLEKLHLLIFEESLVLIRLFKKLHINGDYTISINPTL